jgi:hypothetical protein
MNQVYSDAQKVLAMDVGMFRCRYISRDSSRELHSDKYSLYIYGGFQGAFNSRLIADQYLHSYTSTLL